MATADVRYMRGYLHWNISNDNQPLVRCSCFTVFSTRFQLVGSKPPSPTLQSLGRSLQEYCVKHIANDMVPTVIRWSNTPFSSVSRNRLVADLRIWLVIVWRRHRQRRLFSHIVAVWVLAKRYTGRVAYSLKARLHHANILLRTCRFQGGGAGVVERHVNGKYILPRVFSTWPPAFNASAVNAIAEGRGKLKIS